MGTREIYPNPPLALTVVELRHPAAPALSDADQASLKAVLTSSFPLFKPAHRINLTVTTSGTSQERITDARYMTRDHTASISYRPDAIVVETTRYKRRSALRGLLHQAVEARQKVAPVDGVERLGIRYINEVRAPDVDEAKDWAQWISPALTGLIKIKTADDGGPRNWQGLAEFGTPASGVVLRHGIFDGYAVDPTGDLRRPTPNPGPFYLIDMDSFWASEGDTQVLEWESVETRFDAAALSANELFEQLVTDEYRREVLRVEH
ncbi:TIGR04255 family protein [Streptomyces cocklensis]|uniref:TIGR04255 family protein n=1 Tax=Actinacidiphila cocklensis TaxID=887465 RepID=A0A9W4GPV0_9ACTN|nr:TIGR04255 family protein [Actinacidiphila cocklensis]MDD1057895.1 TIGR04255 family protein [Actinacidiphila cocklensis]CAG6392758.1 conserved hypothetical protein [Actinacidiphila cocklensis]